VAVSVTLEEVEEGTMIQGTAFEAMVEDTMRELVQVALSTPATANLSGPRATVDSRAALKLATSPVEGLPVAVAVEDSMVESINEWDCIKPLWTSPAFGCSESLGNHHQIIDTWRKETYV